MARSSDTTKRTRGERAYAIDTQGRSVNQVCFSPTGRWLAGGGGEFGNPGSILLWESPFRSAPRVCEVRSTVWALGFSPDGRQLASGYWAADEVQIFKLPSFKPATSLPLVPPGARPMPNGKPRTTVVAHLAFAADGRTLAAGCWDMAAKLWDVRSRELRVLEPKHTDNVDFVAFANGGSRLITGTADALRTWNVKTGKLEKKLHLRGADHVWEHALSPDGRQLVSVGQKGSIRIWDATTWKFADAKTGCRGRVTSAAFSPTGRTVAIGLSTGGIAFFDMDTRSKISEWRSYDSVISLSYSPDGTSLAFVEHNANQRTTVHVAQL